MKTLVTGGAGFIGCHLAEALLRRGDQVQVIDNLSTGSRDNISHLLENPRFEFVFGDIMDRELMGDLTDGVDVVYHFAAAVGVKHIMENPLECIRCNVHGTESVLEAATRSGCKVLLASTSEVYGKNSDIPSREGTGTVMGATTTVRWSYACAKALNEFMALAYARDRQLSVIIARLFNVCGPRQTGRYGMVVPRFVRNALLGEALEVYGDGTQSRCFAYVGDVTAAAISLVNAKDTSGQIFNIGSTVEVTIRDLARRVLRLTNSSSELKSVPYHVAYGAGFEDMPRRVPDTSKIQQWIDWHPKVGLDELLEIVIAHEMAALQPEHCQ